jgi:DNA-3-methyladenine glycosylase
MDQPALGGGAEVTEAPRPLGRDELPEDTEALARFLVGTMLVRDTGQERMTGRIVETEAYPVGDASSHAFRGRTRRNGSMFLQRGHAYIYIAYGVWPALNVSSEAEGVGAGVLIRAVEPVEGLDAMRRNRPDARLPDLTRGPGRLTAALAISLQLDGTDLCAPGPLWLARSPGEGSAIGVSVRIGISKEAERALRFFERGSAFVSGPRKLLQG